MVFWVTWYPRRAKNFSFLVLLEICSVLSICTPKNTALMRFKISPTFTEIYNDLLHGTKLDDDNLRDIGKLDDDNLHDIHMMYITTHTRRGATIFQNTYSYKRYQCLSAGTVPPNMPSIRGTTIIWPFWLRKHFRTDRLTHSSVCVRMYVCVEILP